MGLDCISYVESINLSRERKKAIVELIRGIREKGKKRVRKGAADVRV